MWPDLQLGVLTRPTAVCVCTAMRAGDAVQGGGARWGERAAAHVAVVSRSADVQRRASAFQSACVWFVGLWLVSFHPSRLSSAVPSGPASLSQVHPSLLYCYHQAAAGQRHVRRRDRIFTHSSARTDLSTEYWRPLQADNSVRETLNIYI